MRVPTDLRAHYPQVMLKHHLGRQAEELIVREAARLAEHYRDEFARLRRRHQALAIVDSGVTVAKLSMDDELVSRFACTWQLEAAQGLNRMAGRLQGAADADWEAATDALAIQLRAARQALRRRDDGDFRKALAAIESRFALRLAMTAPQRTAAIDHFNAQRVSFLKRAADVLDGESAGQSLFPAPESLLPLAELWGHPAAALVPSWVARLQRGNRQVNPKTHDKFALCADTLATVLGRRCVESLRRQDMSDVLATWQRDGNGFKTLDTKLRIVVTLLRPFLQPEQLADITREVLPARPTVNEAHRLPFRPEQLQTLLRVLQASANHPADGWLFVLMLMTGARLEEVCQLEARDCGWSDGYAFVTIADQRQVGDGATQIKNAASARILPLMLSAAPGMAEWFSARLAAGGRLFPEMQANAHGDFGGAASKRINRLINRHLARDRRLVLQSTRQTVAVTLRRLGVDARIRRRFLGHEDEGLHEQVYDPGERLEFADLLPAADAVSRYVGGLLVSAVGGTPDTPVGGPTVVTVGHEAS
jgi:integrase